MTRLIEDSQIRRTRTYSGTKPTTTLLALNAQRNSVTPERVLRRTTDQRAKAGRLNGIFFSSSHLFFKNMFLGYEWLASVLRMAEFTPLIREIVASIVTRLLKIQEADKLFHVSFSLKQLLESRLPHFDALKSHLPDTPLRNQINLTKLLLKNSKIVNSFVIQEYTSWGKCNNIDLSETLICDSDILRYEPLWFLSSSFKILSYFFF